MQENEILKIPVTLDGFAFKKGTQNWAITFTLEPEQLELGKPLMDYMNSSFILVPVKINNVKEVENLLTGDGLDSLDLSGLNGR